MSKENVVKFLNEIAENKELKAKFQAAGSQEEGLAIINNAGYEASADDVNAVLSEISGELSEDDLENVAGGVSAAGIGFGIGLVSDAVKIGCDIFKETKSWGW